MRLPPPTTSLFDIQFWLVAKTLLPVSFTYVNDNPQEVIVGERRELASLDLVNHFITGTSFEWLSSAGWPSPLLFHLSDHKEIKISPGLERTGQLPQLWEVCNKRVKPNILSLRLLMKEGPREIYPLIIEGSWVIFKVQEGFSVPQLSLG